MKKYAVLILCLVLVLMAGCGATVPNPKVEAFLNTELDGEKSFNAVKTVEYSIRETQTTKKGEVLGIATINVTVDKSSDDDIELLISNSYSGCYIVDGVTQSGVRMTKATDGYSYITSSGGEEKTESVDNAFASDFTRSLFFTNNEAYDEGGLYYGDYFMLSIYKYPETSFYVDDEQGLCVFDEKMVVNSEDAGEIQIHQISKVNEWGLLESNYERFESVEKDYVLISELLAKYTY